MHVDIRLMDQLDASIAECDTIFAGERHAVLVCLEPHLLTCLQMPDSALCRAFHLLLELSMRQQSDVLQY